MIPSQYATVGTMLKMRDADGWSFGWVVMFAFSEFVEPAEKIEHFDCEPCVAKSR